MSTTVTLIYVAQTGHVLSAVTRADTPPKDASVAENAILTNSGIVVRSLKPPENSTLEFLIEASDLRALDTELNEATVLTQPRRFIVKKEKCVQLPNPKDLKQLTYQLTNNGLSVVLGENAVEDLPIWALIRRGTVSRVAVGTIPKNESATDIGFTIDPTAKFDLLLLVAGYPPFQSAELAIDTPVVWVPPTS